MSIQFSEFARELTEAQITEQRDGARGMVLSRLEMLYGHCLDNMGLDGEGRTDARYAELAVRILDRIAKIYRLESSPVQSGQDAEEPASQNARLMLVVQDQIAALAARAN